MTRARGAAALAALVLATSGCGLLGGTAEPTTAESTDSTPGTSTTPRAPSAPLQLRPVEERVGDGGSACSTTPMRQPDPQDPVLACDEDGGTYDLAPAEVVGGVEEVRAERDPRGHWTVLVVLDGAAREDLSRITRSIAGTDTALAMLCQGVVLTAPTVGGAILDGRISLSGSYSQEQAEQLAERIRATQG